MERKVQVMDQVTMTRSLARITHEIIERNEGCRDVVLLGVKKRGVAVAQALAQNILRFEGKQVPCGFLDVTPYRDDFTAEEKSLRATPSVIPCDIQNKVVVIVDDVFYTGRTARAAVQAVFALGRPKAVQLAVLIDRGHREIPIRPDYVGKNIPTAKHELVSVVTSGEDAGAYILG